MDGEKFANYRAVKAGIGTNRHWKTLREAGATKLWQGEILQDAFTPEWREIALRQGDVLIMVSPHLLTADQMRIAADHGTMCQVVGHPPMLLDTKEKRREFLRLKQVKGPMVQGKTGGRPPKWPRPTAEQVQRIVAEWQSDKHPQVAIAVIQTMMDAPVPRHWIKDVVKEATGSTSRKPAKEN